MNTVLFVSEPDCSVSLLSATLVAQGVTVKTCLPQHFHRCLDGHKVVVFFGEPQHIPTEKRPGRRLVLVSGKRGHWPLEWLDKRELGLSEDERAMRLLLHGKRPNEVMIVQNG